MAVADQPDDHQGGGHLAGSHVLLTGATGFLGQATLEKLAAAFAQHRIKFEIAE